jgi:hypothetical protein
VQTRVVRGSALLGLTLLWIVAPRLQAQTGGAYDLTWNTYDGGGITFASGGVYELGGTVGQHDAGASSSGPYSLSSGFWGIANLFPPAPLKILSITRLANGQAFLQCLGVPNQVNNLQVSPSLIPANFAAVSPPPAAADATGAFSYQDVAAGGTTKRFYRLIYP